MTIKSLDFQVLLPKTQEVAKQMNNLRQHDPTSQQHLAQQAQKEQSEERAKVKGTVKTEQDKVKEKREREGKNNHKQELSQKQKGKSKNKTGKQGANLGKNIDITI